MKTFAASFYIAISMGSGGFVLFHLGQVITPEQDG